jgi:hypothetical protein
MKTFIQFLKEPTNRQVTETRLGQMKQATTLLNTKLSKDGNELKSVLPI